MIDDSCSFETTAWYAGSLCAEVNGDIDIDNVTSHASVKSTFGAGGLVGHSLEEANMTFANCLNTGHVEASSSIYSLAPTQDF